MRISDMSDGNTIRNKTRTPNILQNADRPLPSPVATMKLSDSDAPNTSPNTNKTMVSQKLQTLKQRKLELEKQLQEKNTLLQNLCLEEAKLIGCSSYSLNELGNISGIDCSDGSNSGIADRIQSANNLNNNNSTLTRRHIDTGFKLPENLLNSTEDVNINQLLLSKQIQQQISQASLRMASDASQTKSIRRTHKQSYDASQQKIQSINHTLRMLKDCVNIQPNAGPDDMNINNNLSFVTLNSVNNNKTQCNTSMQMKPNLNVSTTSLEHSAFQPPERRNSAVSTSSVQYLAANATKARQRCDSYSGSNNGNLCISTNLNQLNGNEKILHSPSYYPQQFPHLQYKSHADKIAYVTNAVANAAPSNINTSIHSPNGNSVLASPKYGRLRNPLTVDTNISHDLYAYPALSSNGNQPNRIPLQPYHNQHVHRHSPYLVQRAHSIPSKLKSPPTHAQLAPKMYSDEEDDIAGQYATLLTLSETSKHAPSEADCQDADTHYTEILYRQPSIERRKLQAADVEVPARSTGLGGYWTTNENNERVWNTMDNRYSSLDRKSQKLRVQRQALQTAEQPTKSTSLGSFNFITKPDEPFDPNANENKRCSREKQWIETSLDSPPARRIEQLSPVSPVPSAYYRDKNRLSSHSMHSPSRNPLTAANTSNVYSTHQPPPPLVLTNTPKTLSTSATALTTSEVIPPMTKQPLSPPYYHNAGQPVPTFDTNQNTQLQFQSSEVSPSIASPTDEHPNATYAANASISEIHVESPKNMTVVQQAKFQPYKEVSKPFEMSDFYKYSTKFRQKTASTTLIQCESSSPKLPPKNAMHMKGVHRPIHSMPLNVNAMAEPSAAAYSVNQ